MEFTLLLALGVVVIFLSIVTISASWRRTKARQARMAWLHQWAHHHGLRYTPNDLSVARLSSRAPFNVGADRIGRDIFRGSHNGRSLVFGEYQYTTRNRDKTELHQWQFVALELPAPRPYLSISRANNGLLSSLFGDRGLQLESQEFNDRFKIQTTSERFAYDVLNPRTMEWLLADAHANTVGFRFDAHWAITVRSGELRLDEVHRYADFLDAVIRLVPDFVWRW
ncbi:DUF3137 domain-containing protein [Nocardia sp. NPDC051832]|uniref:DUF3137 domain-containing protein n=1 Tax=Nocardia sp. NPDC051832 TaxID=3155673 RepID=UPI00341DC9EB